MSGPLEGIRVIDLANERAELAGRLLADLGAEVIAVEPPGGSASRRLPPFDERTGESLYWATVALGKRSVTLDIHNAGDRARLRTLLLGADVFIESFDPGTLTQLGLGYDIIPDLNPSLVYTSVTPYGQRGPSALTPATDLTLEAAGGLLSLQGDPDLPPIPIGYPEPAFHAGVQAAADIIIALNERVHSGRGQHLDLSTQAAVVWTLMNATGFPPNTGRDPPGTCAQRGQLVDLIPGVDTHRVRACKDGYVVISLIRGGLGVETMDRTVRWVAETGQIDPDLLEIDWLRCIVDGQAGTLPAADITRALDQVQAHLMRYTKQEIFELAMERRIAAAPVYTVADLLTDPQLEARGYWQSIGGRSHAGPFARFSETPIKMRMPAPEVGEANAVLEQPRRPTERPAAGPRRGAFSGLKVADFAWVGVGPMIGKALADHGATVVRVESTARLDILRERAPFKDDIPGVDRAQYMANFNSSKLGITLDLETPGGRAAARKLADWADVVTESFRPGVAARFGLDYETLSEHRDDLVMLSTSLRGQSGPQREFGAFGSHGAALSGIHSITGWPGRPPHGPWSAHTDVIAPRYGIAATAAALYHRERTGVGQYIDLAQIEAAIHFIEPLVLDYTVNGRVAGPAGHDSLRACPHGVFQTAGTQRFVAIAVETASQWHALREAIPLTAFAEPRYDQLHVRQQHKQAIEDVLRDWCRRRDPFEAAAYLQRACVPASVVQRPSDLYEDPQLAARGFFVTLDHPVMGPTPYDGPATIFSETPATLRKPAPLLGEDTHFVLREFLEMNEDEIAELAAAGALA